MTAQTKSKLIVAFIIAVIACSIMMCGCSAPLNTMTIIKPKEVIAVKEAIHDSLKAEPKGATIDSTQIFIKTKTDAKGKIDTMYIAKYYPSLKTLTVTAPPESIKVMVMDTLMITQPAKVEKDSIWARIGYMVTALIIGLLIGNYLIKR